MSKVYIVVEESYGDFDMKRTENKLASLSKEEANTKCSQLNSKRTEDDIEYGVKFVVDIVKLV